MHFSYLYFTVLRQHMTHFIAPYLLYPSTDYRLFMSGHTVYMSCPNSRINTLLISVYTTVYKVLNTTVNFIPRFCLAKQRYYVTMVT